MKQLNLFPEIENDQLYNAIIYGSKREKIEQKFSSIMIEELNLGKLVSYVGNKNLPILRLYRYKEAFAFDFVKTIINRFKLTDNDFLFEPFSGMGTTLFTAMQFNIPSLGIDRLPIAKFIAETLPLFLTVEPQEIKQIFNEIRFEVNYVKPSDIALDVKIIQKAFSDDILFQLKQWKTIIHQLNQPYKNIFLLLFFSILEDCSYTAKDGQFLRMKLDKQIINPTTLLEQKVFEAEQDILITKKLLKNKKLSLPILQLGDARNLSDMNFPQTPTAIITSPPYPNRYDYTRTYCLELCFNFVDNFEELKELRFGILRSHIESKINDFEQPNHPVLKEVIDILNNDLKGLNNSRIPVMLTTYFIDMEKVIKEWSKILAPNGKVAMVVDNVRFAGEIVPVDLILSEIAESYGFITEKIIVTRYKGNSSQQMGKYGRIPVRESVLIWKKGE
jgi:hypothetical protein